MGVEKAGRPDNHPATDSSDFCSIDDLVRLIGADRIDRKTLFNAAKRGELAGTRRIGRQFFVHKPTFMAWFESAGPHVSTAPVGKVTELPVGTEAPPASGEQS